MTVDLSKSAKKQLEELVYAAHERALREPLLNIAKQLDRWRAGEIDAIDAADLIRKLEGPINKIYDRFTWSRNDDLLQLVAGAIHTGLLNEATLSNEVAPAVGRWLAFFRDTEH